MLSLIQGIEHIYSFNMQVVYKNNDDYENLTFKPNPKSTINFYRLVLSHIIKMLYQNKQQLRTDNKQNHRVGITFILIFCMSRTGTKDDLISYKAYLGKQNLNGKDNKILT